MSALLPTKICLADETSEEESDPRLPVKTRPGVLGTFKCPFCLSLCPSQYLTPSAWRKHLIHDLKPYSCTYDNCEAGNQMFETFEQWAAHENMVHNHVYLCKENPRGVSCNIWFRDSQSYASHVKHYHAENASVLLKREILVNHVQVCEEARRECPFCLMIDDDTYSMNLHIAHHLESIALTTLPSYTGFEEGNEHKYEDTCSNVSTYAPSQLGNRAESVSVDHLMNKDEHTLNIERKQTIGKSSAWSISRVAEMLAQACLHHSAILKAFVRTELLQSTVVASGFEEREAVLASDGRNLTNALHSLAMLFLRFSESSDKLFMSLQFWTSRTYDLIDKFELSIVKLQQLPQWLKKLADLFQTTRKGNFDVLPRSLSTRRFLESFRSWIAKLKMLLISEPVQRKAPHLEIHDENAFLSLEQHFDKLVEANTCLVDCVCSMEAIYASPAVADSSIKDSEYLGSETNYAMNIPDEGVSVTSRSVPGWTVSPLIESKADLTSSYASSAVEARKVESSKRRTLSQYQTLWDSKERISPKDQKIGSGMSGTSPPVVTDNMPVHENIDIQEGGDPVPSRTTTHPFETHDVSSGMQKQFDKNAHIILETSMGGEFHIPFKDSTTWEGIHNAIRSYFELEPDQDLRSRILNSEYDLFAFNNRLLVKEYWGDFIYPGSRMKLKLRDRS